MSASIIARSDTASPLRSVSSRSGAGCPISISVGLGGSRGDHVEPPGGRQGRLDQGTDLRLPGNPGARDPAVRIDEDGTRGQLSLIQRGNLIV